MIRPSSIAVDAWSVPDTPRPLASWYAEGVSDGLGDRLLMFDNSGTASLELLRFRPELAAVSGFEDALRERTAQLLEFAHPAFPSVRAVEHLEGGGLALVSTFTAGERLAEIFRNPRTRGGVHPAFAAWLIRDLTSALAALQRQASGIAHAGLTPDRIVIAPDGRLKIVEHVLGSALDRLRLPAGRLRHDLDLIAPEHDDGTPRLDCRTDVIQLGWVVLSALIGRRTAATEYPQRVEALVDEFVRAATPRSPALVTALRSWLERALQVKGDVFGSAMDAHDALLDLGQAGGLQVVAFMGRRHALEPAASEGPRSLPPVEPAWAWTDQPRIGPGEALEQSSDLEIAPMAASPDVVGELRVQDWPEGSFIERIGRQAVRRARLGWIVAIVFMLVAVAEGVTLSRRVFTPAAAPPAVGVPITVDSLEPGDAVIVNGRQVGVTPLTLTLTADVKSVQVQGRAAQAARTDAGAAAIPAVDRVAGDPTAAALAQGVRERRGGLQLISPVEVQVLEGDRVLGSSADGPIVTTVGRHELEFINAAVGYRSRQVVDIKPGRIEKMTVSPPGGRISINAVPWAQVWINGNSAGDTPLANLPLAVGENQVTFRHPQLGEQTQRVIVKSGVLTRVSVTFAR